MRQIISLPRERAINNETGNKSSNFSTSIYIKNGYIFHMRSSVLAHYRNSTTRNSGVFEMSLIIVRENYLFYIADGSHVDGV